MSQSASRSESGSASGSRSSSRSSSNSMKLPEPAQRPDGGNAVVAPASAYPSTYPSAQEALREVPSVFIGLGPAGRTVKADELADLLRSKALDASNIRDIRLRGRCAFADTTSVEEARNLIAQLDNYTFKDTIRLSVQMSKQTLAEAQQRRKEREEIRGGAPVNGGCQVFVNLGPKGERITDDTLRAKIEAVCPVVKMERRGYCVYVDVNTPEDTQKVVAELNDAVVDEVRLVAMVSVANRKRERKEGVARRGGRSPRRDDRRSSRHRRRRSDSRDGARRRRHRRSYTPSSRSSSRSYSRGRRSYSSDSLDSRDDRRGGRRGHRDGRRDDRRDDRRGSRRGDRRDRR